ncbi:MAG: leucine-rich repeat protein, partial [Lachnospiraceae bacterium]|nr:leucine-rich repeat protein [Lachnospiraceae bacterium]
DDALDSDDGEKFKRGNDVIRSVTMNSVGYLPDYAFDSCENLIEVNLGPACKDIGTAPFRGCYEMERVGDNEWYTTTNGIIYSKNEDGSLTIEECLSARGRKTVTVGGPGISASTDENLKSVSAIKPGAFEDCDDIVTIDFGRNGTAGLLVIPEDCFRNCDKLQSVTLPITVNDIGRGAFVGAKNLSGLTIYGDEVKISGSAFDGDKVPTTVRAYEDSAVARYVKEYGDEYKLYMNTDHPLDRQWQVSFYDANYQLIEDLVDDLGNPMDNPQYVEDGKTAVVPANPTMEGWIFEGWVGLNDSSLGSPIREDTIFYAQGHFEGGKPINGNWVVEFFDGVDGQRIGGIGAEKDGTYLIPAGTSFADNEIAGPIHPTHAGFEPNGFTSGYASGSGNGAWTEQTKIDRNMTIIALYKASTNSGTTSGGSTNTSGGTTNTSGGTTNTSGGTTSNKSSSSSKNSSSSSSSSSSSTSTTSTTSGAGQYTVFVENGSGSGRYAPGTTVIIQAAIHAEGMRFYKWTTESNVLYLA